MSATDHTLTDAEVEALNDSFVAANRAEFLDTDFDLPIQAAVESILTARLATAEAEKEALRAEVDEWKSRRDAAVEQCRFLHQDGKTREQWHTDNCGAVHLVKALEKLADEWGWISDDSEYPTRYDMWRQLRETLSTRIFDRDPWRTRAEAAEAALARLVAGVTRALDDEEANLAARLSHSVVRRLRALLREAKA